MCRSCSACRTTVLSLSPQAEWLAFEGLSAEQAKFLLKMRGLFVRWRGECWGQAASPPTRDARRDVISFSLPFSSPALNPHLLSPGMFSLQTFKRCRAFLFRLLLRWH